MYGKTTRRNERGATLLEFSIGALVFFTALFAIFESCRLLWTHNALADAARRGARYAVISSQNAANVKNVVVYGNPAGGTTPVVYGLTTSNVNVTYAAGFGVKQGTVSVSITGYNFNFTIPLIGATLVMPDYRTTLTGESAGYVPANL